MKQIVIRFGLLAACLLVLMQIGHYSLIAKNFPDEVFYTLFAILFLTFGYFMSRYIHYDSINTQMQPAEQSSTIIENAIDQSKIVELKISNREYEVLELINLGHSNQEISKLLFISESTVKSHVSSLLSKLNSKRRTQAIKMAKELQIL